MKSTALILLLITLFSANIAQALPSAARQYSNSCLHCHSNTRDDLIRVMEPVGTWAKGALSPQDEAALATYRSEPGKAVEFNVEVVSAPEGGVKYALQLKGLGAQGAQSSDNQLAWSATGNESWMEYQGEALPPYFATDPAETTPENNVHSFELTVEESTPYDTYELAFTMAMGDLNMSSQEVPFLLEVVESSDPWESNWTDTGDFLGWIYKKDDVKNWYFVVALDKWVYVPIEKVQDHGGWVYVTK